MYFVVVLSNPSKPKRDPMKKKPKPKTKVYINVDVDQNIDDFVDKK